MVNPSTVLSGAVAVVLLASLAVIYRIDRPGGRWGDRLRSRLVMGVPWGTLVACGFVLAVYLFVQGGHRHWYNPVTTPYRAWSFLYPLGMLTAAFAHSGPGHLLGNLAGALVFGSVAEFAWGHFPGERGESTFSGWRTNPWVRALVVVPAVVILVGVVGVALSMGPVIGFSGVVFALAGFALTRYPLGTVVAMIGSSALRRVYEALTSPIVTATPSPSPPSPPWWAGIAIQGHAVGLFTGVILGAWVFHRREETPSAARVWTGVVLFAFSQALWAVYWYRGTETYVLYQGPGTVLVILLGVLVTAGITAADREVVADVRRLRGAVLARPRPLRTDGSGDGSDSDATDPGAAPGDSDVADPAGESRGGTPLGSGNGGTDRDGSDGETTFREAVRTVTWRQASVVALVVALGLLGGPGLGSNFLTVADQSVPGKTVQVRDYEVTYAEGVTNEMVAIVNVSAFNETTKVETSGVIVSSERRHIWRQVVSKGRLAWDGQVRVGLGGLGWRSSVVATRRGWSAAGGGAAYKVWLTPEGESGKFIFNSSPAEAAPVIRGRNVSVVAPPGDDDFRLLVTRNNSTLANVTIPDAGNVTTAGGLEFVNRDGTVYAVANATRVKVASKERYR